MFKKRFAFACILLLVFMLLLAACGIKEGSNQKSTGSENESQTKEVTAIDSLYEAAKKEGQVIYYESSPQEAINIIAKAFEAKYPGIKLVQGARLNASNIGTRIIVETQGGTETADVGTTGGETGRELTDRNMLEKIDFEDLGIDKKLPGSDYIVSTTATTYVLIYNPDLVPDAEIPQTWEALLDPKWKGKIGSWQRPDFLNNLVDKWGEDKVYDYAQKLKGQELVFYESTYPLAGAVAAGELPLGIGIYHSAQPTISQGAPLKIKFLDPTPVALLYSFIPSAAPHPNAAKLFLSWLESPEGNIVYEEATKRGHPLIEGTETNKMLKGVTLASMGFDQENLTKQAPILEKLTNILLKK